MVRMIVGSFMAGLVTTLFLFNLGSMNLIVILAGLLFWYCLFGAIIIWGIKDTRRALRGDK